MVKKYLKQGSMLLMGCGTTEILFDLDSADFSEVLGVDISSEAVERARQVHADLGARFVVSGMAEFQPDQKYDLIIFSDSIYHLTAAERKATLRRLANFLTRDGVIVVTLVRPHRFIEIIDEIRSGFTVIEDRLISKPGATERHVLVFHA